MVGKEEKGVGKTGRLSLEDKQRRLTSEGKKGVKKVMFRLSEEKLEKRRKKKSNRGNEIIGIELKKLEEKRKNVKEELRGLKERIKEYEERR